MVSAALTVFLLLAALPAMGGQRPQLCLSCHPSHYAERGGCQFCHHGNPASARKNIAHDGLRGGKYIRFTIGDVVQMKGGQRLIDQLACRRCHVTAGVGNVLAVSLDVAAARKTAVDLALSIRRPVATMPDFALKEEQITSLVNSLFAGSQGRRADEAAPVRVHFITTGKQNADVFSTKCGSCHRLLSQRLGAVGSGDIAPNLSGLFSKYYPKTFRDGESWSARKLGGWTKNPRETRTWATMPPVALTGAEIKELESIIFVSAESGK